MQNPVNSTRFALSQTHFLSNSDQSGARTNSSEELFPLNLLSVILKVFSSQLLTNQEPGPIVQRNLSHSICLMSILCIGWNWQEIFPDLNTIKDKGQVPDYIKQVSYNMAWILASSIKASQAVFSAKLFLILLSGDHKIFFV